MCRMQKRIISVMLAVVVSVFLFAGIVVAQDFSADMVSTTSGGVFTGKIFSTKEKSRMETSQATTIIRVDKKLVWILMPGQNMYMEQPLKPENVVATTDEMPGEVERKLVGTEMIAGEKTNKYRIVYEASGNKETIFQWIGIDSALLLKMMAEDGSWTFEYKNMKTGKQPDSLFEIPAGYQKLSFGMPVMP